MGYCIRFTSAFLLQIIHYVCEQFDSTTRPALTTNVRASVSHQTRHHYITTIAEWCYDLHSRLTLQKWQQTHHSNSPVYCLRFAVKQPNVHHRAALIKG